MPKNLTQAEWDAIEKEFLKNMNDRYFQDIRNDIQTLRKNRPESIKSQLCLAFTLADSLSRIHKIFSGVRGENLDKDNEDRFRAWMDAFVLTEKNDEYKKYKGLIAPNSKVLWNIRNSFLHFYSFPPVKEGQDYVIFGYNLSVETNSNVKKAFQEKGYKAVTHMDALRLIEAIFSGFLVQLIHLTEMIKNNPAQYIENVLYARNILFTQSAVVVPKK
ncbi:MAG: hypothetical protein A3B99_02900 [Candidatus Yanofskybacteria bacterium RIFCSPHIGHO2_02_FULL_44_12b]|uniref:Uncharacterized protein n=1 Tax=Candidatus Zambryskibacteria bacterium RIFCSPLOWO2_01_FULL_47_14 TaxID=1802763 RepID=A0A1G2U7U1_9BACT|nr:MAG: hypothetical protein A3B99_02900 [Candidatus Yanofskybacteria bacterium RIFCSPHIGHO2_02_FULL_44_12b]OHB05546.1 MAG: hypothetical protein A3A26_03450 [Candidatus Zambryskibacteria bacterium RIFCSPLOWO2_01_FULL_47_14]